MISILIITFIGLSVFLLSRLVWDFMSVMWDEYGPKMFIALPAMPICYLLGKFTIYMLGIQ